MGKVMSHVGLFEVPNYHKLVVLIVRGSSSPNTRTEGSDC